MKIKKLSMMILAITAICSCKKDNTQPTIVLGDTVQSMNLIGDNAYVMVNESSKIEIFSAKLFTNGYFVINEGNFQYANGSISFVDQHNNSVEIDITPSYINTINVSSPRYMTQVSDSKAYITDWGINGIQVIDLTSNTISSTIKCGLGPEEIVESNGFAYVCNVGGWGLDSTVSIINISTDMVENTLTVGDKPNSVVVDVNGAIWVLTGGYTEFDVNWNVVSETAGNLVKIVGNTIEATYPFVVGNHPEDLVINDAGTTLYYSNGSLSNAVYAFDVYATTLPTTILINKSFYGLGCNDNYIYGTDVVDYVQQGWSFRYTENGVAVDSVRVGIIPGGYCFN